MKFIYRGGTDEESPACVSIWMKLLDIIFLNNYLKFLKQIFKINYYFSYWLCILKHHSEWGGKLFGKCVI